MDFPKGQHLFWSPHSDDAVYSCGGLLARLVAAGHDVRVITVCGGEPPAALSRHAQRLHARWGLAEAVAAARRAEDQAALALLGVQAAESWDVPDALYRQAAAGEPLYPTHAALFGPPAAADAALVGALAARLVAQMADSRATTLYAPLGLGGHVDHTLVHAAARRLYATGVRVRFYEEWPYGLTYRVRAPVPAGWSAQRVAVETGPWLAAAQCYHSQTAVMAGSAAGLTRDLLRHARQGGDEPGVRLWQLAASDAVTLPLVAVPGARLRQRLTNLLRRWGVWG